MVKFSEKDIVKNLEPVSFGKLTISNTFIVPFNQRPYSWGRDNWLELFEDLSDVCDKRIADSSVLTHEHFHFLGPMFFIEREKIESLEILDGQQRLVTLSILLDLLYDLLNFKNATTKIKNKEALELFGRISTHLFSNSSDELRLVLGEDNSRFYEKLLSFEWQTGTGSIEGDPTVKVKSLREEIKNNGDDQLLKCYSYFLKLVIFKILHKTNFKEKVKSEDVLNALKLEDTENYIYKLYESISDGVYVLTNRVVNIDTGYAIYETLNQRGEKLLIEDLFKNLIFEYFGKSIEEKLKVSWRELSDILGDNIGDFLRSFWLSKYEFVRERKLFSSIRKVVALQNGSEFEAFFKDLIEEAKAFVLLTNYEDPFWTDNELAKTLWGINKLGFKQGIPLLLAAHRCNLQPAERFKELAKTYLNLCVRKYTVMGKNPNENEELYGDFARKLRGNKIKIDEIILELKGQTPIDSEFEIAFSNLIIKKSKVACYLLVMINDAITPSTITHSWRNDPTLEHIIPQSLEDWWTGYLQTRGMKQEDFVSRLGNFTILSDRENVDLGQLPYPQKLEKYIEGRVPINEKTFDGLNDFNSEAVSKREKIIAKIAIEKKVWGEKL